MSSSLGTNSHCLANPTRSSRILGYDLAAFSNLPALAAKKPARPQKHDTRSEEDINCGAHMHEHEHEGEH
jgi:hypothetical protein